MMELNIHVNPCFAICIKGILHQIFQPSHFLRHLTHYSSAHYLTN